VRTIQLLSKSKSRSKSMSTWGKRLKLTPMGFSPDDANTP
jgi:hypothetical protein